MARIQYEYDNANKLLFTYNDRDRALVKAAKRGDAAGIRAALAAGADPETPDLSRQTERGYMEEYLRPLHYAVEKNCVEGARALLAAGADPNRLWLLIRYEGSYYYPLTFAVENMNVRMIEILLEAGASSTKVELSDNCGYCDYTAIGYLIKKTEKENKETAEMVALLARGGVDLINVGGGERGDVFTTLIKRGFCRTARALVDEGFVDPKSYDPLELFATAPNEETADFLTTVGVSNDACLLEAAKRNYVGVVKKYLIAGLDSNYADAGGNTPLHATKNAEIAGFLLDFEADINARNKDCFTPLDLSLHVYSNAFVREASMIALLLERGAEFKRYKNPSDAIDMLTKVAEAKNMDTSIADLVIDKLLPFADGFIEPELDEALKPYYIRKELEKLDKKYDAEVEVYV